MSNYRARRDMQLGKSEEEKSQIPRGGCTRLPMTCKDGQSTGAHSLLLGPMHGPVTGLPLNVGSCTLPSSPLLHSAVLWRCALSSISLTPWVEREALWAWFSKGAWTMLARLWTAGGNWGMREGSTVCRTGSPTDQVFLRTDVEKWHQYWKNTEVPFGQMAPFVYYFKPIPEMMFYLSYGLLQLLTRIPD